MVVQFTTHMTPYGLNREVFVYLPDELKNPACDKRYPVLYMFDGHNLFFDEMATYGTCWGLKEYMDAHPHAIIVAPECNHEGHKRLEEYSPYDFSYGEVGDIHGTGRAYMEWLVGELKPYVDGNYPTLPDREHTAIGGSSMGGLMSLYGITAYNHVFSAAACLAPSVRFALSDCKAEIKKAKIAPGTRVYISWGEKETRGKHQMALYTANALEIAHKLQDKGAVVYPYFQLNGKHCEADWRRQLPRCFRFLFGWK